MKNNFFKIWVYGLIFVTVWMSVTYGFSALISPDGSGASYGIVLILVGIFILIFTVIGGLQKLITSRLQSSITTAIVVKVILVVFLILIALLRLQSTSIYTPSELAFGFTSLAIYSSAALAVLSLIVDVFALSRVP